MALLRRVRGVSTVVLGLRHSYGCRLLLGLRAPTAVVIGTRNAAALIGLIVVTVLEDLRTHTAIS